MRNMLILLNHRLSDEQVCDARKNLGIESFIKPSFSISEYWKNIDPSGKLFKEKLTEILDWINSDSQIGDYIVIQGEFGASFYIIEYSFNKGLVPVYATTKRVYAENSLKNNKIERKHVFRHVQFRRYVSWEKEKQSFQ